MTRGERETPEPLFDRVVRASGLASIIASVAVARACIRADVDPKALTPESLVQVLPHLQQTLQLYLQSGAEPHISAIGALAACKPCSMQVEVRLSRDDVADLFRQFVPLEIELGKGGSGDRVIAVDALNDVVLVPGAGVRLQCAGRLRWPVLGIGVPLHVPKFEVMLLPSLRTADGHEQLVFKLRVEDADIAWVPTLVDQGITERVNRELTENNVELSWSFGRSLSHVFNLPSALTTAASLGLKVSGGELNITEASLGLTAFFVAAVTRRASLPVHV